MVALQYWFDFYHTSTWINHRCTYVPFTLECPSHLPPIPTHLGYYRTPVWVPWVIQQIPIGYLFTYANVYVCTLLFPFILPSPSSPSPLSISLVSMSVSSLLRAMNLKEDSTWRFQVFKKLIPNICLPWRHEATLRSTTMYFISSKWKTFAL